jgi:hypothetical protein
MPPLMPLPSRDATPAPHSRRPTRACRIASLIGLDECPRRKAECVTERASGEPEDDPGNRVDQGGRAIDNLSRWLRKGGIEMMPEAVNEAICREFRVSE